MQLARIFTKSKKSGNYYGLILFWILAKNISSYLTVNDHLNLTECFHHFSI